jgi:hypothetical protein
MVSVDNRRLDRLTGNLQKSPRPLESTVDSQEAKPGLPPDWDRPSFLGRPTSFHLWARVGPTFWGGLVSGLGLGLFAAKFLEELGFWRTAWVGFIAIVLVGLGPAIAIPSVRRSLEREKQKS